MSESRTPHEILSDGHGKMLGSDEQAQLLCDAAERRSRVVFTRTPRSVAPAPQCHPQGAGGGSSFLDTPAG